MPCPICHEVLDMYPCPELAAHPCAVALKRVQNALTDDLLFYDNLGFIIRVAKGWRRLGDGEFMVQQID